jgi:fructuronate reductase
MLNEQAPTLKVKGVDLGRYADLLIARYSNPALRHRTWQIAMDGSQKLPQRMLDSVRWHWCIRSLPAAGAGRGRVDALCRRRG